LTTELLTRPDIESARHAGAHRAESRRQLPLRTTARPRTSGGVSILSWVFVCLSLLPLWVVLYVLLLSGLQESRTQHQLYGSLRAHLAAETVPVGGLIKNGTPVALLDIPAAGLHHAVVVEGTSSADLQGGPGHLANTVLPGQAGVSALLGRSVTFGAPFGRVAKLGKGNPITVTTGQGVAHYYVTDVRRPGDPLPPALSAGEGRLTLVTVAGTGWRSGWAPTQTIYVDASLQGSGSAPPAGRPSEVPPGQAVMDGEPGALVPLVLWLEALVIIVVAATWARARWGTWQVWLAGAPVLLAVIWVVTETSDRLLPNLL
jgi:sortase A